MRLRTFSRSVSEAGCVRWPVAPPKSAATQHALLTKAPMFQLLPLCRHERDQCAPRGRPAHSSAGRQTSPRVKQACFTESVGACPVRMKFWPLFLPLDCLCCFIRNLTLPGVDRLPHCPHCKSARTLLIASLLQFTCLAAHCFISVLCGGAAMLLTFTGAHAHLAKHIQALALCTPFHSCVCWAARMQAMPVLYCKIPTSDGCALQKDTASMDGGADQLPM